MIDNHLPSENGPNDGNTMQAILAADGIVVSSRIRLVRNIADFPFVNACSDDQRSKIELTVKAGLNADRGLSQLTIVDSDQLDLLERQFLMELQTVAGVNLGASSESTSAATLDPVSTTTAEQVAGTVGPESLATEGPEGDSSLILNEEDHLRIQVTRTGFDLENAWSQANQLDDLIEQHLNYAFNPRWGYLTACPANVGTGMRASVLLQLPGLVLADQISDVLRGLSRANISAREFLGDETGSELFRIGNQTTLGLCERDLIRQLTEAVGFVVQTERQARSQLIDGHRDGLQADVSAAFTSLLQADLDDATEAAQAETIRLLSKIRLGVGMDLLKRREVEQIIVKFQRWKLRQLLEEAVRREDYVRASALRDRIQFLEGGSP